MQTVQKPQNRQQSTAETLSALLVSVDTIVVIDLEIWSSGENGGGSWHIESERDRTGRTLTSALYCR